MKAAPGAAAADRVTGHPEQREYRPRYQTMMPIVQTIAMLAMNPIIGRMIPRMIKGLLAAGRRPRAAAGSYRWVK